MTSILKVSTIQDPTNSNTALTISSDGKVNFPNSNYIDGTYSGSDWQPTTNGIPDWHNEIVVSFWGLSVGTTGADIFHQVYVGGSKITSGYQYVSYYASHGATMDVQDRSSAGDVGFDFYGFGNVNNTFYGTATYNRVTNSDYVARAWCYNGYYPQYAPTVYNGLISLSGPISGVGFYTTSSFDSGKARVTWR